MPWKLWPMPHQQISNGLVGGAWLRAFKNQGICTSNHKVTWWAMAVSFWPLHDPVWHDGYTSAWKFWCRGVAIALCGVVQWSERNSASALGVENTYIQKAPTSLGHDSDILTWSLGSEKSVTGDVHRGSFQEGTNLLLQACSMEARYMY